MSSNVKNKYYEVISTIEGKDEVLYGSFDRNDCVYELDATKEQWKEEGHRKIRIKSRLTESAPDKDVYELVTSKELHDKMNDMLEDEMKELSHDEFADHACAIGMARHFAGLYLINTEF